jgi:LmbE family N-acetylglucosaminyl deacetylase
LPPGAAPYRVPVARSIVFLHAHPDDEAIFTGGTMVRLAEAGHEVVLVVATGGELGEVPLDFRRPDAADPVTSLADLRREESARAAALLGVDRIEMLGHLDSGMAGDLANDAPGSFWSQPDELVAGQLGALLEAVGASCVVGYDPFGVYGHPDHIKVARAVDMAAGLAGIETVYGATVDREHLHFVETHLVEEAALAGDLGLVRSRIGVPSVEVATTIDVRSVLDRKRAAMAAHASQIPESASTLMLPQHHFADVYGWEWYVRAGPPGPLDRLARR